MIIIPARLASTRFPEKVLADIGGLPMVIRTAKRVESIDRVVVACDDEKILEICAAHGVEARLTSTTHKSGTDRINECAQIIDVPDDELIINVQADEPFIETEVLELLIERLRPIKAEPTGSMSVLRSSMSLTMSLSSTSKRMSRLSKRKC